MSGQFKEFPITIACGASLPSTYIDVGQPYHFTMLQVPSLSTGTDVSLQASCDCLIWRDLYQHNGSFSVSVLHSAVVSGGMAVIPGGIRYMRPRVSPVVDNTEIVFKLICSNPV